MLDLDSLKFDQFENLIFDIISLLDFSNVTWRTPGADGGRDIEALRLYTDPSGTRVNEKWHIECKKYTSSVAWADVYQKIAHADCLESDYLLLCTNSTISPQCIDRIDSWNNGKRLLKVRVWSGYDIWQRVASNPAIAQKYGFGSDIAGYKFEPPGFSLEISKLFSTAYNSYYSGNSAQASLELGYYLAEMYRVRLDQFERLSKFFEISEEIDLQYVDWLSVIGEPKANSINLCVFVPLCAARFVADSDAISVKVGPKGVVATSSASFEPLLEAKGLWRLLCYLCDVELRVDNEEFSVRMR